MAAERELARSGALDGMAESFARVSGDGLGLGILPACAAVNLRAAPGDERLTTDVRRALGIALPLEPNRWHGDEHSAAVWLGPDEWLLLADDGEAGRIEQALREARPADPWLAVTDVSHNDTRLSLSGPGARDLLARGCPLDLHPDAFPPGACAQTLIAKSRVLLRVMEENRIEIRVRNSFGRYLAAWLLDACAGMHADRASAAG